MFDPPISVAANIFVIITVCVIAIGAAIIVVDVYKNAILKNKNSNKE